MHTKDKSSQIRCSFADVQYIYAETMTWCLLSMNLLLSRYRYLNAWQWIDGTIAYSIATSGIATMPACGQFYMTSMMQGVKLKECYVRRPAHVLCEMEAESGSQLRPEKDKPQITFLEASAWANDSKVMCPEGHVTHNFLSCDLPSSCWQQTSSSLCEAPLGILPPTFTCDNGFDRVPYTLVCDHRTDCPDGSDEDFCQFASCYSSGKYDCGNQQVISLVHTSRFNRFIEKKVVFHWFSVVENRGVRDPYIFRGQILV